MSFGKDNIQPPTTAPPALPKNSFYERNRWTVNNLVLATLLLIIVLLSYADWQMRPQSMCHNGTFYVSNGTVSTCAHLTVDQQERAASVAALPANITEIPLPEQISIGDYVMSTPQFEDTYHQRICALVYAGSGSTASLTTTGKDKFDISVSWLRKSTKDEVVACLKQAATQS